MQQLPDRNELMKIARSPAGQQLMAMLQSGNPSELNEIAAEAAAGTGKGTACITVPPARILSSLYTPKQALP